MFHQFEDPNPTLMPFLHIDMAEQTSVYPRTNYHTNRSTCRLPVSLSRVFNPPVNRYLDPVLHPATTELLNRPRRLNIGLCAVLHATSESTLRLAKLIRL